MRKIFAVMVVFSLICCAKAAGLDGDKYLYWMLDADPNDPVQFTYAKVAVEGDNIDKFFLTVGDTGEEVVFDYDALLSQGYSTSLADLYSKLPADNLDQLSFYIELYGFDDRVVGTSQGATYSELFEAKAIYEEMGTGGVEGLYHFVASSRTPEPTSGLLVLLGMGALALRRKRVA